MDLHRFYKEIGGDLDSTLRRFSSEEMLLRFIHRFTEEPSYATLRRAIEAGDVKGAFLAVHTLKGIAATLGFDDLASAASRLTEALRGASVLPDAVLVAAVDRAYRAVCVAIEGGCDT